MPNSGFNAFRPTMTKAQREEAQRREQDRLLLEAEDRAADEREEARRQARALGLDRRRDEEG